MSEARSRAWASALAVGVALALAACGDDGGGGADAADAAEVAPDGVEGDTADAQADAPGDVADDAPEDVAADGTPDEGPDVPPVEVRWEAAPLGDLGALEHVHAVTSREAYAVGGRRVLRWNGATWAPYGEPGEAALHGVWADDAGVVVVGDGGFIARRAAGALPWTRDESGVEADLYAVTGRAGDDLLAVGAGGTVLRYDGDGWTVESQGGTTTLRAVWMPPGGEGSEGALAVGTGARLFEAGPGGDWTTQQVAASAVTLHAVWGAGTRRFAAGTGATLAVRLGPQDTWKGQTSNLPKPRDLMALAGAGPDEVLAFGDGGAIVSFAGQSWSVVGVAGPYNALARLVGAAYGPAVGGDLPLWLAVADTGGGLRKTEAGWVDMATGPTAGLSALAASASGTLWASGRRGLLLARFLQGWTAVPTGTTADLHDVAVGADGTVWAVGAAGTVVRRAPDGATAAVPTPLLTDLYAVALVGDDVVVGGKGGTLLRGPATGAALEVWVANAGAEVRDLALAADGALWLAGGAGRLARSADGGPFEAVPTGVGGALNALLPDGDGVIAAGDNGVVLRAEPGDAAATLWHEQPGLFLFGLARAGDEVLAAGWNGTVLRGADGALTPEPTGTQAVLEALWSDGDEVVLVGRLDAVLTQKEAP